MSNNNQNQRLNGLTTLSYLGQNPSQPTNFTVSTSNPTSDDSRGFNLGDWWLNASNNSIWYLAATNGLIATWIQVQGSGTGLLGLTGNTGSEVFPLSGNINIIGDGATMTVSGNPGTSTLTLSSSGSGGIDLSLTGDTGGPVSDTAGNINIVGAGDITVTGNLATSTLTISESGAVAKSFVTQAGTAVPVAGVLNVYGSNNISTSGSGSTVTVTAGSNIAQSYITSPATGTAIPSAGALTFTGSGTTASVSASGSTVTISGGAGGAVSSFSTGSFTPTFLVGGSSSGISYRDGNRYGNYVQMGNLVFINILIAPFYSGASNAATSISGLPFTVSNAYGSFFMETAGLCEIDVNQKSIGTTNQYMWLRFNAGATTMSLFGQLNNLSTGNAYTIGGQNFASGTTVTYHVMNIQGFYYI